LIEAAVSMRAYAERQANMDEKPVMEGRQDIQAPEANPEKSDPTPVDEKRGLRMWLGTTLVGVIFLIIIIWFIVTR
jgi:hypothetical protein